MAAGPALTMTKCPDIRNLQALLDDAAPGSETGDVLGHLETCVHCQHTLETLVADPGAWDDAAQGLANCQEQEPALRHMVERLQGEDFAAASRHEITFLRPTDKPSLLGLFGPYEVLEVIGQGGMGIVFKALEPSLERVVALKVLAPRLASSVTARRRFIREGKAAAAVTHDHIVAIHGVSEAEGLPYIVMQHIIGESLQDRLDRAGPLELEEIVRIGLETASGLAAAHAQGLIHRDIKPANLLLEGGGVVSGGVVSGGDASVSSPFTPHYSPLTTNHSPIRVKITDFGLARMADDTLLTQDGVVTGTPEYMAPEQARGEPVDHRADLFSLGSVLYAMATGSSPFRGNSTVAVLRQVSDESPVSICATRPDMPEWMDGFVARLLAKNPAERFQSAGEVLEMLAGYLSHLERPEIVPVPEMINAKKTAGRSVGPLVLLITSMLVIIALGIGVAAWLAGSQVGENPKDVEPQASPDKLTAEPPIANDTHKDFYYDFRNKETLDENFKLIGPNAVKRIKFEPEGMRITLAAEQNTPAAVGVTTQFSIKGDFEITIAYEILRADKPKKGSGAGLEIFLMTDTPTKEALAFSRRIRSSGLDAYTSARLTTTIQGKRGDVVGLDLKDIPASGKSGQLRITRIGANAVLSIAETTGKDFLHLYSVPLGMEDITFLRLAVNNPSGTENFVDLRLHDFHVRSAFPDALKTNVPVEFLQNLPKKQLKEIRTPTGSVAISLVIGMVIILSLALVVGLFVRRRRQKEPAAQQTQLAPAPEKSSVAKKSVGRSIGALVWLITGVLSIVALGFGGVAWFGGCGGAPKDTEEIVEKDAVVPKQLETVFHHEFRRQPDARRLKPLAISLIAFPISPLGQAALIAAHGIDMEAAKPQTVGFPGEFKLFNLQVPSHVQFRPEGVLIKVPKSFKIPKGDGVGLVTYFGLRGDFDITLAFDHFQAQAPASGPGAGLGLYMHAVSGPNVMISRVVQAKDKQVLRLNYWHGGKNEENLVPCEDKAGRMRFKRTGSVLLYLWAAGLHDGEFQKLFECDLGNTDMQFVRINAYTGGMPCDLDVRLIEWSILGQREDNPRPNPISDQPARAAKGPKKDSAKTGPALTLLIGLVVTLSLALVVCLFVRRRRRKELTADTPE